MRTATLGRLASAILAAALAAGAFPTTAVAYPSLTPDFAHSTRPHSSTYLPTIPDPALSPANATGTHPLLVIYVQFSDVYPGSPVGSPRKSAAALAGIVFTGFPSVAGVFLANSGGRFRFTPVPETSGTVNDGVVSVTLGTLAATRAIENPPIGLALKAAEPYVDFASLDTNRDGCLFERELAVLVVAEEPGNPAGTAPGRVTIPGDGHLDGKSFSGSPCRPGAGSGGIRAAGYASTYSPAFDYSHELAHEVFHLWDLYGPGAASYDPTGVPPGDDPSSFNAWTKIHLGWVQPTVVTRDGYYVVTTGTGQPTDAYVLYDDSQGVDDYFLVENRQKVAGGFDAGVSDSGVLVWRVRDSLYGNTADSATGRWAQPAMTIMRPDGALPSTCSGLDRRWLLDRCRPCDSPGDLSGGTMTVSCAYQGRNDDLWDASDPQTPQRSMTGLPWQDGSTPSNLGMFAVPGSSTAMRVYFDVRGPGVLVDCGFPAPTIVASRGETITLPVTVRNTGEVSDSFVVFAGDLPAGWSGVSQQGVTLGVEQQQAAQIQVRVGGSAAPGTYTAYVAGSSTTGSPAASACPITVTVGQAPVTVSLFAPTGVTWGVRPLFTVTALDTSSTPLAGARVTFALTGDGFTNLLAGADAGPIPSQGATVAANASGFATWSPLITVPPGVYTLTASIRGGGGFAGGRASQRVTVSRRPTSIAYTGATSGQYSDPVSVSAYLLDAQTSVPIAGALEFRLGNQAATASGRGGDTALTGSVVLDLPVGDHVLGVGFAGNVYYAPSTTNALFQVFKEGLVVSYSGTTLSLTAAKRNPVSVQGTENDGTLSSAGDLTRAQVLLQLHPTLGHGTGQHRLVDVAADGTASWQAGALPADVYRVTAWVPDTNPWYAGSLEQPTELVVTSLTARIHGGGSATDEGGSTLTIDADTAAVPKVGTTGRIAVTYVDERGPQTVVVAPPTWIAQSHAAAIIEGPGNVAGTPVTVRVQVLDGGLHGHDTISVRITDWLGAVLYFSGSVTLQAGDLVVG